MPAYVKHKIEEFIRQNPSIIIGSLQQAYAADGFVSQYTRQTKAWAQVIPELQRSLSELLKISPEAGDWTVLLEYPLYRLRRRIDIVVLTKSLVVVVECKVGAETLTAEDRRQVEEYALDLRDFHAQSYRRRIIPVVWGTETESAKGHLLPRTLRPTRTVIDEVTQVGTEGLQSFLAALAEPAAETLVIADEWDQSTYRPVPNVIDAATSIFAGHDVRNIAKADADNLHLAAARLLELIERARREGKDIY